MAQQSSDVSLHQAIHDTLFFPFLLLYSFYQWVLDRLLSPTPPAPSTTLHRPKIAVVGAGLTGVSAASHCVGHGFDVTIFEAGGRPSLGGIWAKVNNTSGLQINSLMYRFQPSVKWSGGYPKRNEIVDQIEQLWLRYGLQDRTKFGTRVEKTYKDEKGRWIINNPANGRFDGIIAAVGSCGEPKMAHIPGQENFKGEIYHSSQLDGKTAYDKEVAIIGGGASAVEALEFVNNERAAHTSVLARSEKWIIPRNAIIDALLSLNVFGQETVLSWIPENLLRIFFYRDLKDISPPKGTSKGLFTETPMVNSDVFNLIRTGKAQWLRGDIHSLEEYGIRFNHRAQGVPKGGPGTQKLVPADIIIMATGFTRPSLQFLPETNFEGPYSPPNWYLQVFPPEDSTICANNCTYVNAIGTVGNYHIGIYTRFLLMFLVDPLARPSSKRMKMWIDMTRWVKQSAPGGSFEFFTYGELLYWFLFVIVINPFRWKWALFVLFGVGSALPLAVVREEDRFRGKLVNGT
ncbi:MAG: hypothetical protein M1828_006960 [Chrysothrix sp. TS-e1954]|nr:MAG: hypothetical protein M1828_006960 [Chrysothrix sp. TS-e1954]